MLCECGVVAFHTRVFGPVANDAIVLDMAHRIARAAPQFKK
jgi:hypothetical protein